ncbi:D-alanine--D-alanine ligase [Aspergillus terreus]|uniref:D-alanine--D-alanine ligase n=1 Tax=Aspergillus terreus TaxID=33178 RepID=A0A5M3ZDL4_ASPTE|nr:hypothetical protein ATETN484_0017001300 [Aspergillus terreus]GFF21692.1 D-alanine--D-alanine ligase [Aspergillus terreus]
MGESNTSPLRIALIAELRSTYHQLGYSEEDCAALPHSGEVDSVLATLRELGHHVILVTGIRSLVKLLAAGDHVHWDLVFNMAQGFHGTSRESQVPALLDAYQIPYTFSDSSTMALCQHKANTKAILNHYRIPTAPFFLLSFGNVLPKSSSEIHTSALSFPVFLKPVSEGSSKGIDDFNKVNDIAELETAVQNLKSRYPGQDILVESFLSGPEYTVSILGTGSHSRVVGVREHIWSNGIKDDGCRTDLNFATRKNKSTAGTGLAWSDSHDMTDPRIQAACQVALDAWKAFGCHDAGRVDIRFDSDNVDAIPNVLEVSIKYQ